MADAGLTPAVPESQRVPTLSEAKPADSRAVWQWRNDETTRAASGEVDVVPWEVHEVWFASVLADPKRHLLIASSDAQPVGVVRFDEQAAGDWLVSINLSPAARGRGLGTPTLETACRWLETVAGARRVIADIRRENTRSIRTFLSAGFRLTHEDSEWMRYERAVDRSR